MGPGIYNISAGLFLCWLFKNDLYYVWVLPSDTVHAECSCKWSAPCLRRTVTWEISERASRGFTFGFLLLGPKNRCRRWFIVSGKSGGRHVTVGRCRCPGAGDLEWTEMQPLHHSVNVDSPAPAQPRHPAVLLKKHKTHFSQQESWQKVMKKWLCLPL